MSTKPQRRHGQRQLRTAGRIAADAALNYVGDAIEPRVADLESKIGRLELLAVGQWVLAGVAVVVGLIGWWL